MYFLQKWLNLLRFCHQAEVPTLLVQYMKYRGDIGFRPFQEFLITKE